MIAPMEFPRLLVIDQTRIGDGTATGQIKRSLLGLWPQDCFAQIYSSKFLNIGVHGLKAVPGFDTMNLSLEDALVIARGFAPQVILYRPTPNQPTLHEAALAVIDQLKVPLVVWMMDDWLPPLKRTQPGTFQELDRDVRRLLEQARLRLSICDEMSIAFEERYEVPFKAFANGIDPDDWPAPSSSKNQSCPLRVRYAGSLAHDMSLDSILRIAQAVEELATEGLPVTFEIKTRAYWGQITRKHFKKFKNTSTMTAILSEEDYRHWLCDADIVVIAYNFDRHSLEYIKYSRANKLPECLACGAALLIHGPTGLPTVNFVAERHCGAVASTEDIVVLKETLRELIQSADERKSLVTRARTAALEGCDLRKLREALKTEIAKIAASQLNVSETSQSLTSAYPESAQAYVDETEVIALLCHKDYTSKRTMIHAGTHTGSSVKYLPEKVWTVHRFDPLPENRSHQTRTFNKDPNVMTVARIVQDQDLKKIDLLKINANTMSFAVLEGVPWDNVRPFAIECEFNDAMTIEMGMTYRDIASYFIERGYATYVSEWHPIAGRRSRNTWYRLKRYPCELAQSKGWGKLLAFRDDPTVQRLRDAFETCLKTRETPASHALRTLNDKLIASVLAPRIANLRLSTGHWLKVKHPRLYAMAARVERRVWQLTRYSLVLTLSLINFFSMLNPTLLNVNRITAAACAAEVPRVIYFKS